MLFAVIGGVIGAVAGETADLLATDRESGISQIIMIATTMTIIAIMIGGIYIHWTYFGGNEILLRQ